MADARLIPPPHPALEAAELQLLRQLCRTGVVVVPPELLPPLRQHPWAAPDHRVVFDALLRLANTPAASLRSRLPVEATRMGFPDIDWSAYLEHSSGAESCAARNVPELIARILTLSAGRA